LKYKYFTFNNLRHFYIKKRMNMLHGHAAGTCITWTLNMVIKHGHAGLTLSMDTQQGHAACTWTRGMNMQHKHTAWNAALT
jgi:hypothetical protein